MVEFSHGTGWEADDRQGNGLAVATRRVFFVLAPSGFSPSRKNNASVWDLNITQAAAIDSPKKKFGLFNLSDFDLMLEEIRSHSNCENTESIYCHKMIKDHQIDIDQLV